MTSVPVFQCSNVPLEITISRCQLERELVSPDVFCITNKIREVSYEIVHRIYPVKQVIATLLYRH